MIDTNAVISAYLKTTSTSLYTLVGTRIYCAKLPADFQNTQAAILFMRRGGTSRGKTPQVNPSYQFKCYGGTSSHGDAETVYRALWDRLAGKEMQMTASGMILQAEEEVMGQTLTDPDSGWPFVLAIFRIKMRPTA